MEIRTKQIGDFSFTCTPLTGKKTIKVFVRLCNVLGPVVKGVDIAAAMSQDEEGMAASLMGGVAEALTELKDVDAEYLTDMFTETCTVSKEVGKVLPLKQLGEAFWGMQAPASDWVQWLFFCITTNYADFLGEKGAGFMTALGLKRKGSSQSKSPEESTGTVGASL